MSYFDQSSDLFESVKNPYIGVGVLALVAVLPFLMNAIGGLPFLTSIAIEMMIFAVFAMSFNLLVGYTGYVSFGHTVFLGSGAYMTAILMKKFSVPFIAAAPAAVVGTGLLALVVGVIAFRRSGVYFAMITLGVAQVFYTLFQSWNYVGGDTGIIIDPPVVFGYEFNPFEPMGYYYLALVTVVATYIFTRYIVRSPFGHVLQAIRENEERARAVGYNVRRFKLAVFSASGALAAVSGALYAAYFTQVAPGSTLYWTTTGDGLFMILLGGMGTLIGPIIGSVFVIGTQYALSSYLVDFIPEGAPALIARLPERWPLLLGLLFIVVVLRFRSGIAGGLGFSKVRSIDDVLTRVNARAESEDPAVKSDGGDEK